MIVYNHRYRGPYEYEKFVLNIFQLWNQVVILQRNIKNETRSELLITKEEFDETFDQIISASHNMHLLKLQYL